ncbi:hypothetical protein [Parasphingorhabdus sp.]|uniref:hypothetical protein n=1 Tax=Parasphingorhabdus sp. TaxID=2709688 RepID=UPI003A925358
MAKKKNQNPDSITLNTPPGVLKWPKVTEPDYGTDKFPDNDGSFNTKVTYDGSDPAVTKFTNRLDKLMDRARELAEEKFAELPVKARKQIEAKSGGIQPDLPYAPVYDEETEEETGEIEMRFKRKYSGEFKKGPKAGRKWYAKVGLFDSAKPPKPLKKGIEIWGGTTAIINAEFFPYFVAGTGAYGITRRLNAVQVLELVSAGGERSASSYGFEGSDDGFDSSDIEADDDEGSDGPFDGGSDDDDDDEADF